MLKKLFPLLFLLLGVLTMSPSKPFKIQAVIFDCDGVLVDTEYLKFLSWQEALKAEGVEFTLDEYKPLVGFDSQYILQKIAASKNQELPLSIKENKNAIYKKLQKQGVPPIKDMVALAQTLASLKKKLGIQLSLASSASRQEILCNLKQIGLDTLFDCIVSGTDDLEDYQDATGKNKPKPYIYREAAKRLQVAPEHCLVFEDTAAGIEAAYQAGMHVIAVPNTFTAEQDFSKAVKVLSPPSDFALEEWF
jgi:beta-phosphoglucomutase